MRSITLNTCRLFVSISMQNMAASMAIPAMIAVLMEYACYLLNSL